MGRNFRVWHEFAATTATEPNQQAFVSVRAAPQRATGQRGTGAAAPSEPSFRWKGSSGHLPRRPICIVDDDDNSDGGGTLKHGPGHVPRLQQL
eukprot:6175614-Pleurochrysis_carterae.AAC.1